ncbi:MAG: hypothetical protein JWO80_4162, partial [Bryobacterales bacterium]|nr:hypothetical protein [Bryobacterales bacterium]
MKRRYFPMALGAGFMAADIKAQDTAAEGSITDVTGIKVGH